MQSESSLPWYQSKHHAPPPPRTSTVKIIEETAPLIPRSSTPKSDIKPIFQPDEDYKPIIHLSPLARQLRTCGMYISFLSGIITLAMTQRMTYLYVGIYAIVVSVLTYGWHFVTDFNKVDNSSEALINNRGWPPIICRVLTILEHYIIQGITTLALSGYLFSSFSTAVSGYCFAFSGLIYLISATLREKPQRITGILP